MKPLHSPILATRSDPRERIYAALLSEPVKDWNVRELAVELPDVSVEAVRSTLYLMLGEHLLEPVSHHRSLTLRLTEQGRHWVGQVFKQWAASGMQLGPSDERRDEGALTSLLVREVSDLLDAGDVGLYEFAWILNSLDRRPDAELAQRCARSALDRLLTDPGVKLVRLRWADPTLVEVLKVHELPADAWSEPGEDGLHVGVRRLTDLPVGDGQPSEVRVSAQPPSRRSRCRPWADLWPGRPM